MMSPIARANAGRTRNGAIVPVRAAAAPAPYSLPDDRAGTRDTAGQRHPVSAAPATASSNSERAYARDAGLSGLPPATLIAQLLATRMGLPQTRTLRRASTSDAEAAYRMADDLGPQAAASRNVSI